MENLSALNRNRQRQTVLLIWLAVYDSLRAKLSLVNKSHGKAPTTS